MKWKNTSRFQADRETLPYLSEITGLTPELLSKFWGTITVSPAGMG